MRRFFARRPSPAMAVGFVALLAALSGTAVALPGVNLIDSGDIKNGQVKAKDIGKNAVTGKKVANGALTGADVKDESLTASDFSGSVQGPAGPQGPQGNTGTQGPQGDTGAPGIPGSAIVARVRSTSALTPATAGTYEQVALTGNTWTQAGDEMNVAWLKAELTNNACVGGIGSPVGSSVVLNVKVDGTVVAPFVIGSTSPLWAAFPVDLEPGTATTHTLTVEATHSCVESGSFTLDSVAINVVGIR